MLQSEVTFDLRTSHSLSFPLTIPLFNLQDHELLLRVLRICSSSFHLNGSSPATVCPRDVIEARVRRGNLASGGVGNVTVIYQSSPEGSTPSPSILANPLPFMRLRYQAGKPHGSTWYLEQTNALGALVVTGTKGLQRIQGSGG